MQRFLGGESIENSPFMRLRVAEVLEVYADTDSDDLPSESTKSLDFLLSRVKVRWLDWGGERDFVQLSFPVFSNPTERTGKDETLVGLAYGDISMPSPGDIVLVGFRNQTNAVVLGYLPSNYYQQTRTDSDKASGLGTMRRIKPGEFSRKSKQQAEIYQDKAGAVQIIVKAQPTSGDATDGSGTSEVGDIDPSKSPDTELARVTIGETYQSETFKARETAANSTKKVILQVKTATGLKLNIDVDGNLEVDTPAGKSINFNSGTNGIARKEDAVKSTSEEDSAFWNFISTLFTTFNAHVHTGVLTGGGTSGVPATPLASQPSSLTGKITESSDSVKAGD